VHYLGVDGTIGDSIGSLEGEGFITAKLEPFQLRRIGTESRRDGNQRMKQLDVDHDMTSFFF
jgi:hypothetical protein